MIDTDTIEKYILGGEWENQYPQVIEELLAEVKQLRTDIADLVICLDNSQDPSWFILKYNEMAQTMWKEGKTWYGQREEGEEE